MTRLLLLIAAGAGLLATGVTRHASLDGRMQQLEEAAKRRGTNAGAIDELSRMFLSQTEELRSAVGAAEERAEGHARRAAELGEEMETLREQLDTAEEALVNLGAEARALRADNSGAESALQRMVEALETTTEMIMETREQLARVESRVQMDGGIQWSSMVAPTVQLAGDSTVGSGVLLPSRPKSEDPTRFRTLLLTSWHVVRDIRTDARDENAPVPVILRDEHGATTRFTASVIAHDVPLDAALLELDTERRFDHGAQLPSRETLRSARVFDPVVAVGCPLGNDPIPTEGHLSDLHHQVSGERFWMISAPTYIGNSGGGLYSRDSHELVGIFSKIYTHGAIRPTVIPHMGLVTPLEEFYDWIDGTEHARVIETPDGAAIVVGGE